MVYLPFAIFLNYIDIIMKIILITLYTTIYFILQSYNMEQYNNEIRLPETIYLFKNQFVETTIKKK